MSHDACNILRNPIRSPHRHQVAFLKLVVLLLFFFPGDVFLRKIDVPARRAVHVERWQTRTHTNNIPCAFFFYRFKNIFCYEQRVRTTPRIFFSFVYLKTSLTGFSLEYTLPGVRLRSYCEGNPVWERRVSARGQLAPLRPILRLPAPASPLKSRSIGFSLTNF